MKWFEHDCDMHTDFKVKELYSKFGCEGYTVWILCLEILGKESKSNGKLSERYRLLAKTNWIQHLTSIVPGLDLPKIEPILDFLAEKGLICPKSYRFGTLYIPNFVKRVDSYAKRKIRTLSEQTSHNVPLQYNTRQYITLHYLGVKGLKEENLVSSDYSLINRGINLLWARCQDAEIIKEGLDWISKKGWTDWTILALDKWWAQFMADRAKPKIRYD